MKVVAQAPTRISLFGGGTDVSPYSTTYGGICVNMAINLRQKFTYSDEFNRINILGVNKFHEAFLGKGKYSLTQEFDGKLRAGLGSSASAAVALLAIQHKLNDTPIDRSKIAEQAWNIEVKKLGLFGGKQDQYVAAHGGFNVIEFHKDVSVVKLLPERVGKIVDSILLFYTGFNRKSTKIQEGMKQLDNEQVASLNNIKDIAFKSLDMIMAGNVEGVGNLLAESWFYKRLSNKGVTNKKIDEIYKMGIKNGAFGGKLCGSGGGGYMIFVANKNKHTNIIQKLEQVGCKHIDFSVCWNGLDTRIL